MVEILDLAFPKASDVYKYEKGEENMADEKVASKYDKQWAKANEVDLGSSIKVLVTQTKSTRLSDNKEFRNIHISIGYQPKQGRFIPNKFGGHLDLPILDDATIDAIAASMKIAAKDKL